MALICGSLLFFYRASKPLTFTVEGLFHTVTENPKSVLSKTIQTLGGVDSSSQFQDDVRTLIDSPPVLGRVVEELHLQAEISPCKCDGFFSRLWQNVRAEVAKWRYGRFFFERLPSKELFPKKPLTLICKDVSYDESFYTPLILEFFEERAFKVYDRKKNLIGTGTLEEPFRADTFSFTLASNGAVGGKYTLILWPKKIAEKGVQQRLKIETHKKKPSLLYVRCTHSDKFQAKTLADVVMRSYQNFLWEEGEKKVARQLQYLSSRKEENANDLNKLIEGQQAVLNEHLQEKGFFSAENELKVYSEKQKEYHLALERVQKELGGLKCGEKESQLTLAVALELKRKWQEEIENTQIQQKNLAKAKECGFDAATLASLINEPSHSAKIQQLEYNLVDKKNWSPKEQLVLQEELETEKEFLKQFIEKESKSNETKIAVLNEKMLGLDQELKYLLEKEQVEITKRMKELARASGELPKAWLKEEALDYHKRLQGDILKGVAATIEERNIACHLQALQSTPLEYGTLPALPNSPKLVLIFLLGGSCGAFFMSAWLFAKEISRGALGSLKNLKAASLHVVRTTHELFFALNKTKCEKRVVLFAGKNPTTVLREFESLVGRASDWKFLISQAHPESEEMSYYKTLATDVVYVITDERLETLLPFKNALFYLEEERPMKKVTPLLEKLMIKAKPLLNKF